MSYSHSATRKTLIHTLGHEQNMTVNIRKAGIEDLASVSKLFDEYRQFYRQLPDEDGTQAFIRERLSLEDSIIFLAFDADKPVGFMQLYPSYSSVAMRRIFILNDLYVVLAARNKGVATALINKSEEFATDACAARLALATEKSNTSSQKLYSKMSWAIDEAYIHYNKAMKA